VRGAVVETDAEGRTKIRVLILPERSAEDVKNYVLKRGRELLDRPIDPSDVLILGGDRGETGKGRRVLTSFTTERARDSFKVRIALERDGDTLIGEVEGSRQTDEDRIVVQAVLDALDSLLEHHFELDTVEKIMLGDDQMGIVWLRGDGMTLSGSALLKRDDQEMVVRATLDALNRQIGG
jgi:hypothetical protein